MKIPANVTRAFHNVIFQVKKHSPEILLVTGIASGIAGTVMACKATTKVQEVLAQSKEDVAIIHECIENEAIKHPETGEELAPYDQEQGKKDLAIIYGKTGLEVAKLYAPAVILGSVSILSILASNNIIKKRYLAASAAFTAVDASFKKYREGVVERFGTEVDRELKLGIKKEEVEEIVVDEDGNQTTVKTTVDVVDRLSNISPFARFFDVGNPYWVKDPEYNLMFLHQKQNYLNDLLKVKGRVFLNEVYKELGMEPTKEGQIAGWVYDPSNPNIDNFIDFGIYDGTDPAKVRFVNGYEPAILLDFNVDGDVWSTM